MSVSGSMFTNTYHTYIHTHMHMCALDDTCTSHVHIKNTAMSTFYKMLCALTMAPGLTNGDLGAFCSVTCHRESMSNLNLHGWQMSYYLLVLATIVLELISSVPSLCFQ